MIKTDFFRDEKQFAAMSRVIIPERLHMARSAGRRLNLWSAACATGEEPYSLGMVCAEVGAQLPEVHLVASDVNTEAIFEAARGVYSFRKLKPVSPQRVHRFFVAEGIDAARVSQSLREMVRFEARNLADPGLPAAPGPFDLILCRNVLIYFDPATLVRVLERLFNALAPGGYLALGYSESLFRIFDWFELVELEGSFFYRRPQEPRSSASKRPSTPLMLARIPAPTPVRPRVPTGIMPVVTPSASGTYPAVKPSAPAAPAPRPKPAEAAILMPPEAPHRLSRAVELIENGKFFEALDLLRALTMGEPEGVVGWITMGNLLTLMRRFPEAYQAYEQALSVEPLSAEARLFMGVALTEGGRWEDANRELSRALFLDSSLALGHYYMGLSAEAGGLKDLARRSFRNCLTLCQGGSTARPFLAHYPDLPRDPEVLGRAAQYALGALG